MRAGIIALLTGVFCIHQFCNADVVEFHSGDRLSGKLICMQGGKITFEAAEVGKVTIDAARVKTFSTDEPVTFHFADGTVIQSQARAAEPGMFTIAPTDPAVQQQFPLEHVASINPPVKPAVAWKGNVAVGLSSSHGNTFLESGNISANVSRRSEKHRTKMNALYLTSRVKDNDDNKVTTEENFTFAGQHDYFFNKKLYLFGNSTFKKDHIADLDYRVIAGGGLGYQWIDEETMHFSTDAGLAYMGEQYTSRNNATWELETTKNDDVSIQLGYSFDWRINSKFSFMHNMKYYPSFAGLSDYYLTTDAEVRYHINDHLFSNFRAILDYDSTPGEDVGTTDTKYILGAGYSF